MTNRTIANFHIGVPKVAADVVASALSERLVPRHKACKFIPAGEYRSNIRSFANDLSATSYLGTEVSRSFASYKQRLEKFQVISASQHALLGAPEQLLATDQGHNQAAKRVQNLSELFSEFDVTFHIVVRNQIHIYDILQREQETQEIAELIRTKPPSWATIISALANRCPNRNFIVWDADFSEQVMPVFALTLLSQSPSEMSEEKLASLQRLAKMEETMRRLFSKIDTFSDEHRERFSQLYEHDIYHISSLENVLVVRDINKLSYTS